MQSRNENRTHIMSTRRLAWRTPLKEKKFIGRRSWKNTSRRDSGRWRCGGGGKAASQIRAKCHRAGFAIVICSFLGTPWASSFAKSTSHWQVSKFLGGGSFGKVYKRTASSDSAVGEPPKQVAVKAIDKLVFTKRKSR